MQMQRYKGEHLFTIDNNLRYVSNEDIFERGFTMSTKQNKTLNQCADYLTWVEKLRGT
jgi:hypothetical protein